MVSRHGSPKLDVVTYLKCFATSLMQNEVQISKTSSRRNGLLPISYVAVGPFVHEIETLFSNDFFVTCKNNHDIIRSFHKNKN